MRTKVGLIKISALFCLFFSLPTVAQVVPDASLPTNSNVTSEGNTSTITGGTQAGSNLFHSFEQFSFSTGGTAYFNNASDIQNIFSRVTGGAVSNIDGIIRANGTANLFLLNPNGIVFGSNARLNIGGSFLGTTANRINFTDGFQFNATAPPTTPLLTVSVPIGLNFGSNPGTILVQGTGHNLINSGRLFPFKNTDSLNSLQVQPSKTLALVGGDLTLDSGVLTAEGGRIELGSVENGTVSLSLVDSGWNLGYQSIQNFKDVQMLERALLNSSGASSGSIQVQGKLVRLSNGSVILNQNQGRQASGSINISASGLLEISDISPQKNGNGEIVSSLVSETLETGQGGDIEVIAKNLLIQNGGQIYASTFSKADGGNLKFQVVDSTKIIGYSKINPRLYSNISSASFISGRGGNISMFTGNLSQVNGGSLVSATFGAGTGGDVFLKVNDLVEIVGIEPVFMQSSTLAAVTLNSGNAGNITTITSRLLIKDGGGLTASTGASGFAGTININASDVEVSGISPNFKIVSFITSSAVNADKDSQQVYRIPEKTSGESGEIRINTNQLSINNGGIISVRNNGIRNAGNLQISANSINLDQGSITAATASGEGGEIFLRSQNLQLRQGSSITATAENRGNGGNINIDTDLLTVLERSEITADAFQGRGGNIKINTQGLFRSPDSKISASSDFGINGTVQINTLVTNPNNGLVELPSVPINILGLVAQGCRDGSGAKGASFVITGRGGLPRQPGEPLRVDAVRVAGATEADTENRLVATNSQTILPESSSGLVEANSWIVNSKGDVILLAQPSQPSIAKSSDSTLTCYAP